MKTEFDDHVGDMETADDCTLILRLLREYSEKIEARLDQRNRIRDQNRICKIMIFALMVLLLYGTYLVQTLKPNFQPDFMYVIIPLFGVGCAIFWTPYRLNGLHSRQALGVLANRIDPLITKAIELYEHAELSQTTRAVLKLRISEILLHVKAIGLEPRTKGQHERSKKI